MHLPPAQIIVVCDHNEDLYKRALTEFDDADVLVNEETRGLSGARNTGVRHAKGQLIAFLDDDAVTERDWLSTLVHHFDDPDVYGAMSRIDPAWADGCPAWFPQEYLWTVGCSYKGMPASLSDVRNLIGAAMCFRREAFEAAGGFSHNLGRRNSRLPLSCEETEFSLRTRRAVPSARLLYDPATGAAHLVPGSRLTLRYFLKRCYAEGLSKRYVAGMLTSGDALSSEKSYVARILPLGVLRGLADFFSRGDLAGLGRAGAIVLGLAAAVAGYAAGTLHQFGNRMPPVGGVLVNGARAAPRKDGQNA
jgi:glycosyltransferase involved in cell wall biosynthesis